MTETWIKRWGGRKFTLCWIFAAVFCVMFLAGKLSEPTFERLMLGTVIAFITGNVAETMAKKKKEATP